jgi:ABC-2 type transport system ATP-binding protein
LATKIDQSKSESVDLVLQKYWTNKMLHLQNIKKYYGNFLALEIPDLELNSGIYWLKGGNGSGKTTLFRMIAGMLPFGGKIVLNQQYSVKDQAQKYRRLVNYGEAEPLYPSFVRGIDLVNLYAKAKKAPKNQAMDLIAHFGASEYVLRPVGTYSSGMLKKLSLILAFLGNPTLILLDEPLITIDVEAVRLVLSLVKDYHQSQAVSFLLSSHQNLLIDGFAFDYALAIQNKTVTYTN